MFLSSLCRSARKLDIKGMFPPIPTPFDSRGHIDPEKLEWNFSKWDKIPFAGVVVMGSNGEFAYLEKEEKLQLVRLVRGLMPDKLLIAGAGCESTRATIDMCHAMAGVGATAVLVHTPCFYKNAMTPRALKAHYEAVADASKLPVILYNVPPNTGIDMDAETILALAPHPNIVGLKDSGGDVAKIAKVVEGSVKEEFQVLAGSAGFLAEAIKVGCVGGVCAAANVFGEEVVELMDAAQKGLDNVDKLQQRLVAPNAAITRELGVPGLKQAMEWRGYFGGPVRPPLLPLDDADKDRLRSVLKDAGLV